MRREAVVFPEGNTLTLYQSKQRRFLYWYVIWCKEDNGTRKETRVYIGKQLPPHLQEAYDHYQQAAQHLQAAIRATKLYRPAKEVQP